MWTADRWQEKYWNTKNARGARALLATLSRVKCSREGVDFVGRLLQTTTRKDTVATAYNIHVS